MKFAIIGCGLIGQKRADAAQALGHTVSVVSDLVSERAQALAARCTGAIVAKSWKSALDGDAEMVVIATPHDLLAEISVAAAEKGKHILVEKPAARTASEIVPVVAAADRNGVTIKVGFNHRFHPAFLKAREIVDSGVLGPLMYIRGRYGHGGRPGYEKEWRCVPEVSGGGELIDQGSHLIDLSRWFLGDFSDVFGAAPTYFWPTAVDDNCFMALRTAGGQMAWLHASWTEWKNLFSFEIFGRVGKIQIDGLGGSYGVERLTLYQMLPEMGPPITTSWEYPFADKSWQSEVAEFVSAIEERRPPNGNIHDAKANLDIVGRIYGGAQ